MVTMSESELRDWLWNQRGRWSEIVQPLPDEFLGETNVDVVTLSPEDLLWELMRKRFVAVHEVVADLSLLGKEVQIAPEGGGRMCMDLFGVPFELGSPGLCIIELKIGPVTARQSFTELLGYGNGLGLHFPALCREDLIHVLVSPMSNAPTIVRNAVAAFLAFDRRQILVLEPAYTSGGEVLLSPWLPDRSTLGLLSRRMFSLDNFDVVVRAWENDEGWWHREALSGVAASAALKMEAAGIHGFTYCAKDYPETNMPLPIKLVCVGLNPFSVAARILVDDILPDANGESGSMLNGSEPLHVAETPQTTLSGQGSVESEGEGCRFHPAGIRISNIVAGMRGSEEEGSPADCLDTMLSVWSSHLEQISFEVVKRATMRVDGEFVSSEGGCEKFSDFAKDLIGDIWVERTPVLSTGRLREMYELTVDCDYARLGSAGEHPLHGDVYKYADEMLRSHVFFVSF